MFNIQFSDVIFDNNIYVVNLQNKIKMATGQVKVINVHIGNNMKIVEAEFTNESQNFYNALNKLESELIVSVVDNSEKLFGVNFDFSGYNDKYKKCAKLPKNIPGFPILYMNIDKDVEINIDKYNFNIEIDKIYFTKSSSWVNMNIISTNNILCCSDSIDNEIDFTITGL